MSFVLSSEVYLRPCQLFMTELFRKKKLTVFAKELRNRYFSGPKHASDLFDHGFTSWGVSDNVCFLYSSFKFFYGKTFEHDYH